MNPALESGHHIPEAIAAQHSQAMGPVPDGGHFVPREEDADLMVVFSRLAETYENAFVTPVPQMSFQFSPAAKIVAGMKTSSALSTDYD